MSPYYWLKTKNYTLKWDNRNSAFFHFLLKTLHKFRSRHSKTAQNAEIFSPHFFQISVFCFCLFSNVFVSISHLSQPFPRNCWDESKLQSCCNCMVVASDSNACTETLNMLWLQNSLQEIKFILAASCLKILKVECWYCNQVTVNIHKMRN